MAAVSSRVMDMEREVGLRGRLEQFGLATVLTFLDLERRSGELVVASAAEIGRIWLRQGQVIRARIDGSRRARKPAVYELLGWDSGRFAFVQRDTGAVDDEIHAPTTMLLIEAARRTDELEAASGF
jgi:two-component system OmpR family response regulator